MRARQVILVLAAALSLACKTYKNQPEKVPPGYEAGVFPPAPGREVFDDGGLIMGGGGSGGGGPIVVANPDGGTSKPGDGATGGGADAGAVQDTAGPGVDGGNCTLLMQNCGAGLGCYPAAGGLARCQRAEPGSPEGAQCFEANNCAPGLTCVNSLCTSLCSTMQVNCPSGVRCVPYPGYDGVGYCLP